MVICGDLLAKCVGMDKSRNVGEQIDTKSFGNSV